MFRNMRLLEPPRCRSLVLHLIFQGFFLEVVCLLVVYCSVVFGLVVSRLHLVTVFPLFAYVEVLLGVVLVFKHSMYHRIRTTTRRLKHSMHHRIRTTTEAQYAPP